MSGHGVPVRSHPGPAPRPGYILAQPNNRRARHVSAPNSLTHPRPTLQAPDDDPHLWLEEIDGERALAWVEAQNADTLAAYADGRYAADRDGLKAALDRPDKIPGVTRRGGLLYNLWQDAGHPRGLWRRTTEAGYRTPEPEWDVLLDLDALARDEGEDWVWSGAASLPPDHTRALIQLSRGGGDATLVREFDLTTRRFVADGFTLPEAKSIPVWLDPDTLLLASPLGGPEHATPSGYARTVRLWRRGTDPLDAPVIFSAGPTSMVAYGYPDREAKPERLVFAERTGFFDGHVHLGDRTGPKTRLDIPTDADAHWHRASSRHPDPHAVGGRRHDAPGRQRARHRPRRVPRWGQGLPGSVHPRPAPGAAGLLLDRRAPGALDPRRPEGGVSGLHSFGERLGREPGRRPAGARRRQRLVDGRRGGGIERRPDGGRRTTPSRPRPS